MTTRHLTFFHHILMVVLSEFLNIMWFLAGVSMTIGGLVIFEFAQEIKFYSLAVGLPLSLIGISVTLFKIHEIILVVVRPKRLEAMCVFCQKNG